MSQNRGYKRQKKHCGWPNNAKNSRSASCSKTFRQNRISRAARLDYLKTVADFDRAQYALPQGDWKVMSCREIPQAIPAVTALAGCNLKPTTLFCLATFLGV